MVMMFLRYNNSVSPAISMESEAISVSIQLASRNKNPNPGNNELIASYIQKIKGICFFFFWIGNYLSVLILK